MKHFYSFFLIVFVTSSIHVFAQVKVVMKTPFTDAAKKAIVPFPEYQCPQMRFHDIFRKDGALFSRKEIELIKSFTGVKK